LALGETKWVKENKRPQSRKRRKEKRDIIKVKAIRGSTDMSNDFFTKMCREAIDELASGEKGWRDTDTNTLFLACFGILYNHLASRLAKPLWWFAGSVFAGVIAYIIISVLGG